MIDIKRLCETNGNKSCAAGHQRLPRQFLSHTDILAKLAALRLNTRDLLPSEGLPPFVVIPPKKWIAEKCAFKELGKRGTPVDELTPAPGDNSRSLRAYGRHPRAGAFITQSFEAIIAAMLSRVPMVVARLFCESIHDHRELSFSFDSFGAAVRTG